MARVLLVDTGFSARPLLRALVAAGHEVAVAGARDDDPMVNAGGRHVAVDYSDADALLQLVDDRGYDRLVPGCNDVSLSVCSIVAVRLGLPGHDRPDAVRTLLDKSAFRELCRDLGLSAPRTLQPAEAVARDVVVKPARGYSGKGVTFLTAATREQLGRAVERATASCAMDSYVIEELVTGDLYSHSAFLTDGRVHSECWVKEVGTAEPAAVDVSFVASPGGTVERAARGEVERMVEALGLQDGLVHSQLLVDGDRHAIIEVTRRCPGDLYTELVRASTGFDHAGAYCAAFTGDVPPTSAARDAEPVLRVTLSPTDAIVLGGVTFPSGLPPTTLVPLGRTGDHLGAGPAGRFGVMFVHCRDRRELESLYRAALRRELHRPEPWDEGI